MRTRRLGPWWRHLVSSKCGMPVGMADDFPTLRQTVLDTTDARRLAEFYRELLGLAYRPGDEPPAAGEDDALGRDWLVLRNPRGGQLAFQQVDSFPRSTWPDPGVPQQLHLDFTVPSRDVLERVHARALGLGARLLRDDADDPQEPIYVYADPDGHPFCVFVAQT
jgi:catechol 2,3-dioxygenase-like lactoylglutathione lyase family enzyme